MSDLLLSFVGDDFTGSTDAMESLARAGVRTVLFSRPPTTEQLARYPGIRAFGVAGMTRSMPPDAMEQTLRPVFESLRQIGAPIVHYKVCSTFDSSPTVGSIGRVIDIGADVFKTSCVPVFVAAPALGRYCVFGNLFARSGPESEPFRLDRHPSMSNHPITPMDEADLRRHLAKQTTRSIGLLDVLTLERRQVDEAFDRLVEQSQVALIDLLYERQLATVGRLLARTGGFMVGSSGVGAALSAHWHETGVIPYRQNFPPAGDLGPIVAVCGSCSPVTAKQIEWALANGFDDTPDATAAIRSLNSGRSIVIHSQRMPADAPIGSMLGKMLREVLDATKIRRVLIAGGDTSGAVANALGIESMEMTAELTRGAPLCRITAPGSSADGIEMTFKGGQIGKGDFFGLVRRGVSDA